MLWLPKWLRTDTAPEPEDAHRRVFLVTSAAAAAAYLLPIPALPPRDAYVAYLRVSGRVQIMGRVYGRVQITGAAMRSSSSGRPFVDAMRAETAAALAEAALTAKSVGFVLGDGGGWYDEEGQILRLVKGDS